MSVTINILSKIALAYLALVAFLYFYQRNMMYFPGKDRPDPAEWGVPDVQVAQVKTKDGLELEGWYFPPEPDKPVLVHFHGNASIFADRLPKVAAYIQEGYGVLLSEYRGYGGNPGKASEQGLYQDGRAYMQWLIEEQKISADRIVLYGESLGSGPSVQVATEYDVGGVVLEAPFTSTVDIAQSTYFFVPVGLLMKDRYQNIDKIVKVKAPLLIIHGERDQIVPMRFGRKLFEAANEPKNFIAVPEVGHNDLMQQGEALHVLEFLSKIDPATKEE